MKRKSDIKGVPNCLCSALLSRTAGPPIQQKLLHKRKSLKKPLLKKYLRNLGCRSHHELAIWNVTNWSRSYDPHKESLNWYMFRGIYEGQQQGNKMNPIFNPKPNIAWEGGGIQLPLKWWPDSSVSSLIWAGWSQQKHPVTKFLFHCGFFVFLCLCWPNKWLNK